MSHRHRPHRDRRRRVDNVDDLVVNEFPEDGMAACPCGYWHPADYTCTRLDEAVTAAATGVDLRFVAGGAALPRRRTIAGTVLVYGTYGLTSKGRLKVAPGALRFPPDLGVVKLTREHDREAVRGHLAEVVDDPRPGGRLRIVANVSTGPEGDEAIREAHPDNRIREGLSFDIVDATIVGDTITAGRVIAIGQVGVPAYDDGRIDQVAANLTHMEGTPQMLTPEQQARLAELAGMTSRNTEEEAEFQALIGLITGAAGATEEATAGAAAGTSTTPPAAAPPAAQQVAASMSAVPSGVPSPGASSTTTSAPAGQAFAGFVATFTDALRSRLSGDPTAITAALADITHSAHTANIEQPAWSGELWSGLVYVPEWSDLFASGNLTNWEGEGWRFTKKLAIQDYAGNKAAIPTDTVTTERAGYEAARAAVGVDVDRKFYDFPNEGFVSSLWEQVRESWAILLDGKVRAYTLANAVPAAVDEKAAVPVAVGASDNLFRAAAVAVRALKRRRVGVADWVFVNDDDLFDLLDVDEKSLPAFLDLFGIDPRRFRSSEDVPAGTVLAGVKPAATVRVLPGSPVRVDAQHIANGGVDSGFFGYWAVEEHHTRGIASASYVPAP